MKEQKLDLKYNDEVITIKPLKISLYTVKRFYSLLEAIGVYPKNKSESKLIIREMIDTQIGRDLEEEDTSEEINGLLWPTPDEHLDKINILIKHLNELHRIKIYLITNKSVFEHKKLAT